MSLFEVKLRDGMARTGEFRTEEDTISSPSALDAEELFPDLAARTYANIPLSAREAFVRRYGVAYDGVSTVHPAAEVSAASGDCIILPNWHTVLENPRSYVGWLIALKQRSPPDTLWYAPASALPANVAFLVYSGFDLFDMRAVDLQTAQGKFCTTEGVFPADEWFDGGTCGCAGCQNGDLKIHNRLALLQEIALVKKFIGLGQLRELVEARCRMDASLTAALRLFDEAYNFTELSAPVGRGARLLAHSSESINRPEVRRFAERVVERFIPSRSDVCVLLPCSARKPYSSSMSHQKFRRAVAERAHELIVTSPLGLVPRELELIYPAAHYDVPVTGYWDREESAIIQDILVRYFRRHPYRRVIAHLDGGAYEIARNAARNLDIELECTCRDHPTSAGSISALEEALEGERKMPHDIISGTLSWQFGIAFESTGCLIRGRPHNRKVLQNRTQLFSIDSSTGLFRPTFAGWDRIPDVYRVFIDDFTPQGDILAPGILDADQDIRPGDEVLVTGPRAVATGRASMGGREMLDSKRGVAVRTRKVKRF